MAFLLPSADAESAADVLKVRDVNAYADLRARALLLFETFCDADVPTARAWSGASGGARKLAKARAEIEASADDWAHGRRLPHKLTGWPKFAAAALALERLFRDDKVKGLVSHLHDVAVSTNDAAHTREFKRREREAQELGEAPPKKSDVPRKDQANERTLGKWREYLDRFDAHVALVRVCASMREAVESPEEFDAVKPVLEAFDAVDKRHAWRTTRQQMKERERCLLAREVQEEEDGLW